MPIATITPDLEMHYEVDDFAEPWREKGKRRKEKGKKVRSPISRDVM